MNILIVILIAAIAWKLYKWLFPPKFNKNHPLYGKFVNEKGNIEFLVPWPNKPKDETSSLFMQFCFIPGDNPIHFFNRLRGSPDVSEKERLFPDSKRVCISKYAESYAYRTPWTIANQKHLETILSNAGTDTILVQCSPNQTVLVHDLSLALKTLLPTYS